MLHTADGSSSAITRNPLARSTRLIQRRASASCSATKIREHGWTSTVRPPLSLNARVLKSPHVIEVGVKVEVAMDLVLSLDQVLANSLVTVVAPR